MGAVMLSLGYVTAGIAGQLQYALRLWDLWGGLWKAAFFGLAIGLIGCRAGLARRAAARARWAMRRRRRWWAASSPSWCWTASSPCCSIRLGW